MSEQAKRPSFRKLPGAWSQPTRSASESHLATVVPFVDLDREWDRLRRNTHIYLATAYGLSLLTALGFIGEFSTDTPRAVTDGVMSASLLFAAGLVLVAVAYVFDLWSGWLAMRNRKRMFAGEHYFVGFVESFLSLFAGLLLFMAALGFALIISWVIYVVWTSGGVYFS